LKVKIRIRRMRILTSFVTSLIKISTGGHSYHNEQFQLWS